MQLFIVVTLKTAVFYMDLVDILYGIPLDGEFRYTHLRKCLFKN